MHVDDRSDGLRKTIRSSHLGDATMAQQTICPICTQPFQRGQILIEYREWGRDQEQARLAHMDCVMHLSSTEERKQPPSTD
jgi:hypothetical protein